MNIFDIAIVILILFGALIGFKRGFTRQLLSFLGLIAIVVLAFKFKNNLSVIMYENLPFFPFNGYLKGVTVFNILLYEILAFFLVLFVLGIALKVLIFASKVFESLLNMTIILGIPSKMLGAFVGFFEAYVFVFIILYVLSLPIVSIPLIEESRYRQMILEDTPLLSKYVDQSMVVFNEFAVLKDKFDESDDVNQFNLEALDLFLRRKVITVESVDKLVEKGKLQIDESVVKNYR